MNNSVADRILDRLLGGDGLRTHTRLGIHRLAIVHRIGFPMYDNLRNCVGWSFVDGSEILESGDGWDTPEGWEAQT